jgi:6-phosphofructokinase 1
MGIVVGGGPAPGINAVIGAAAIRGAVGGVQVLGIEDGFSWLIKGQTEHVTHLTTDSISRIHFWGGSVLRTSRANPTEKAEYLDAVVRSLKSLGIDKLVTIGGDDTAWTAMNIQRVAGEAISVVHVPKTIDNDLDLPPHVDTFGFQTARRVGVEIVKNLMVDAHTCSRWYFAVAMGRKAGHLALGIGKSASATLTLIPEEFPDPLPLRAIVDTLVGAMMKRRAQGRADGVAVLAEGLLLKLDKQELAEIDGMGLDEHGNPRLAEVSFAEIVADAVRKTLRDEFNQKPTIVHKDIGYELRCADPTPLDMEYSRDLGYCAAKYLLSGGKGVMVSLQGGNFVPIPFDRLVDPSTGRTKVRMVDMRSTRYAIARRYMIRLRRDDFKPMAEKDLASYARAAGLTAAEFRARFEYLVQWEPPPLVLRDPDGNPLG